MKQLPACSTEQSRDDRAVEGSTLGGLFLTQKDIILVFADQFAPENFLPRNSIDTNSIKEAFEQVDTSGSSAITSTILDLTKRWYVFHVQLKFGQNKC
jgi:hypothetical protein